MKNLESQTFCLGDLTLTLQLKDMSDILEMEPQMQGFPASLQESQDHSLGQV